MSKSFATPLIFIALGAGIVLVTSLVLVAGTDEPAATIAAPRLAQAGLQADGHDPAGRLVQGEDSAAPRLPVVAPAGAVELPRMREPMAEPATLDAETKAEMDAYLALQRQVAAEVEEQLRGQGKALARACAAQAAGVGDPEFIVSASFDAAGQLVESGVVVPASAGDARELGQCLRAQRLALSATAPGRRVSVEAPLRLP